MNEILTFALLGLGAGAAYAIAAMGVVLVHRGSGVVNFAHVGMAIVGAYTCSKLREHGWPAALAVLLGLLAAGLAGLLTHAVVMQRMQRASNLSRVVATLGILTLLQAAASLAFGDGVGLVPSLLPTGTVHVAGTALGEDRLYLLVISAVFGVVLWAVYRFTRFGQLTTAVAENQRAVAALGRSPQLVAMTNWILGSMLSGAAGILLVPIVGLSVLQLSTLLIPALAAALVGGFTSFGLSWLGALAIGIAESEITRYVSAPGWSTAFPIALVIVYVLARGHALPVRGTAQERLPAVGKGRTHPALPLLLGCAAVALILVASDNWVAAITIGLIGGLLCLSLTVLTGYAGQLSLVQFGLAGCAALVAGRASAEWNLPFLLAGLLAVVVTTVVGVLLALPALRIRGVTLGIVTLGLGVIIEQAVLGNPAYTGGVLGTTVHPPSVAGWSLDATVHPARYAISCLLLFGASGWLVSGLRRGRTGRLLLAVRGNERAAASLGLSVTGLKLYAFALSSVLAAVAGVLFAFRSPNVLFGAFGSAASINVLGVSVIGGLGYIGGAVVGAVGIDGGPTSNLLNNLTGSQDWLGLVTGLLMITTLVTSPDGTVSVMTQQIRGMLRAVRRNTAVPAAVPVDASSDPLTEQATTKFVARRRRLQVAGLSVRFGGTQALNDVAVAVNQGEVLGVIGANGAGKTTLIDTITGLTRQTAGRITLDDQEIGRWSPRRRARAGLVRSFQSLELFDDLTVAEQLSVPLPGRRLGWLTDLFRGRPAEVAPFVASVAADFGLSGVLERRPGDLSYGQRRLLAIARALAAQPAILLLDEPAAGLDDAERQELGGLLRRLVAASGLAVLLVDHDVALVAAASDRVVVLDFGEVIATGAPADVLRDPAVLSAYLGGEAVDAFVDQPVGRTS